MGTSKPENTTPAVRGLENVVAGETRISYVDGANGMLIYNGYDVRDLAENCIFDEAVYLSWHGKLPNRKELEDFRVRLVGEMRLPSQLLDMIALAPYGAHPMDVLRTAFPALSMFDPDAGDLAAGAQDRQMLRLLAQMRTLLADQHRVRIVHDLSLPTERSGYVGDTVAGGFRTQLQRSVTHRLDDQLDGTGLSVGVVYGQGDAFPAII